MYKCSQHHVHPQYIPLATSETFQERISFCSQLFPDIVCHLAEGTGHFDLLRG